MIKVSTLPPDSRPAMGNSMSHTDYQDNMSAHFQKAVSKPASCLAVSSSTWALTR